MEEIQVSRSQAFTVPPRMTLAQLMTWREPPPIRKTDDTIRKGRNKTHAQIREEKIAVACKWIKAYCTIKALSKLPPLRGIVQRDISKKAMTRLSGCSETTIDFAVEKMLADGSLVKVPCSGGTKYRVPA